MPMFRRAALAVSMLAIATAAFAEVKTREVEYKQGDTVLQGFVAWDDATTAKRPGVLVVHEWWGHNEHARNQAVRLARAGYVGFALDMYGKGKLAAHPQDAQAFMAEATKDAAAMKARFEAALAQLTADPHVDAQQIGAIGYCFGGAVVLGMARAGADLKAIGAFHAPVATTTPAQKGIVKARILVQEGEADPMIPAAQIADFKKEMDAAGVSYKVVTYPGAKHGFTNPEAGSHGMEALAYDKDADEKSWTVLVDWLKDSFK
jgi:dienelactone hydrolase